jgi:hypothetical protein
MENVNRTNADRLRSADDVVAAMRVQGTAVAAAIADVLFPEQTARKLSVDEVIHLLADALGRSTSAYREADAAHTAETTSDIDARASRDEAIAALRENVIAAGHAVTGAFGKSVEASMGLDVVWSNRGDLLLSQTRNAVTLIRRTRTLKPLAAGIRVDTNVLADSMEEQCTALEQALEAVKREERAAQQTFQDRELVAREWERLYPGVAEIFTGLCILAGRTELAQRVKPTARKSRGQSGQSAREPVVANGNNGSSDAPTNGAVVESDVTRH